MDDLRRQSCRQGTRVGAPTSPFGRAGAETTDLLSVDRSPAVRWVLPFRPVGLRGTGSVFRRRGQAFPPPLNAVDWDGWLDRLIEDETARKAADIRAYLIAQIRRAMSDSEALYAKDAERLAEIAVHAIIEATRKNQIRPS